MNTINYDGRSTNSGCDDHIHRRHQLQSNKNSKQEEPLSIRSLKFTKLDEGATTPTKANLSDAGWDLYSLEDVEIPPVSRSLIKTGISLQIPKGFVGLIWPRSGLAVKSGIDVFAGVVDSGYRGDVGVCLYNSSSEAVNVKKGDRIAQILFQPVPYFQLTEVSELSSSERGEDGFGSSGR